MTDTVYIVTEGSYSSYKITRVYLDRDKAYQFVDAYNSTRSGHHEECTVEEYPVGAPAVQIDGKIWEGWWDSSRVEKPGQRASYGDLATPGYFEYFKPVEYTDEWKENFRVEEVWYTGEDPGKATVTGRSHPRANWLTARVIGTSKEHVEKVLQDTAAQVKAERAGIS